MTSTAWARPRSRPCSDTANEAAARHPDLALGGRRAEAPLRRGAQAPARPHHELLFSAASLWEIAIKSTLGREDFQVEPRLLRRGLLDNGYVEVPITSQHAVSIDLLPPLHRDPFDRLLLAQALAEGLTLVTADAQLARYPGPLRQV